MKQHPSEKKSLRGRVFFLTLAGMVSLLLVIGISDFYSLKQSTRQIYRERLLLADTLASSVEATLRQNLMLLQSLPITGDPDALRRSLHHARLVSVFSSVFLLDQHGNVILKEPLDSSDIQNWRDFEPVRESLKNRLVISNLFNPGNGKKERILLLVPIMASGSQLRIAGGEIDPGANALAKILPVVRLHSNASIQIADANGVIVASTQAEHVLHKSAVYPVGRALFTTAGGSIHITRREQSSPKKIIAAVPLDGIPWTLQVIQDEAETLAPASGMARRFLLFSVILLLIAVPIAWGVSDSVISPVQALTVAARNISEGEFEQPIPVRGEEEIGQLAQTLDQMRQRLKSLVQEIEASNRALEMRVEQRTAEVRRLYEEIKQKEEVRKTLLHKIISAQEVERRRLSRELHDDLSQVIAALLLGLSNSGAEASHPGYLKDLAARAMDSVHRMILDLRPPVLDDLGLFSAIRSYAEERFKPERIEFVCAGNLREARLDPEQEIELFRIAQEAINNIARHANAENVMITLDQRDYSLVLEVEDDGVGFDPDQVGSPGSGSVRGMGLLSIKERVQLLEGSITIQSTPDSGTLLSVVVPVRKVEAIHS